MPTRATLALCLTLLSCRDRKTGPRPDQNCVSGSDFTQWGGAPSHSGTVCAPAQDLSRPMADIVYDPFVADERHDADGDLLVHYQSPLISGDDFFMEAKEGNYSPCDVPFSGEPAPCGSDAWNGQTWTERKYSFENGKVVSKWRFQSTWKPPPDRGHLGGWEPVFHAALGPRDVYVPCVGGSVMLVARDTGQARLSIDPFRKDPTVFVAGPVSTDAAGNIIYTALKLDPDRPWTNEAHGWLVRATPDGAVKTVSFDALAAGAPKATDACERSYPIADRRHLPVFPLEDAAGNVLPPPTGPCGFQRPSLNHAPAIAADGTIFVVSRAHRNERYSYLLAMNPDLTVKWAASLRGLLADGCGVLVPNDEQPGHCHTNAPIGVDPLTGGPPAGMGDDDSTASPVALPDGAVLYGGLSFYNGSRGHTFKFAANGTPAGSYDFGWDTTPSFFSHDGTYSIVLKDNHYDTQGPYFITQLDANLKVEWKYQHTNTQSCSRASDGALQCVSDHPKGFEWCVNALSVDANGIVYANSEDGNLYAIYQGGKEKQRLFLNLAVGAAYTPLAIDGKGRIYTQNAGHLFIVGTP